MSLVVSDTSPIRGLTHLGRLDLLRTLFGEVLIPPAVERELRRATRRFAPLDVELLKSLTIRSPSNSVLVSKLAEGLDAGESEAIALALEVGAESVLLDERRGRAAARRLGLVPVGILGLLLQAKTLGLVPEIRPLLQDLRDNANFFLTEALLDEVTRRAGEGPSS